MKKLISFLIISIFTVSGYIYSQAYAGNSTDTNSIMHQKPSKEQMRKEFEQRLNLSDKQKEKARQLHKQGRAEIKPVMLKIEVKRQEIETIKLSKMSEHMQQEKIAEINSEIKSLEKQANEIRKKNSQEFEKLLNKKQKAELEKMKAEGRARFEQSHPVKAPFYGLGAPHSLFRPLFPATRPIENRHWK